MTPELLNRTFLEAFTPILIDDLLRYIIAAGGVYLLINIALAVRLARRKIRGVSPPKGQIRREILASLRTVVIFALSGAIVVLGAGYGVFHLYLDIGAYGWTYLVASTLLVIVLHDAYFYWAHRALHYPPLFRLAHKLHHKSNNPTPFTSFAFNSGEAVANALFAPLVLLVLPLHPLALLIFSWHMMLRNAVGHSGYELFPAGRDGRPKFDWLTTVTHHDLHHANARWNMGLYFTWWDRWMGTEHPDYHARFRDAVTPRTTDAPQARPA
jgi:lathosterol oxidase